MEISETIRAEALRRGITRLCHFTPSRNLAHIANDDIGVLSTKKLKQAERALFNPTDLKRFDRHEDHVCCSIQYPNAWYFDRAQANEPLFRDWVVLFIAPEYLWRKGTLFCQRNASACFGAGVRGGDEAFRSMFARCTQGAYGRKFTRAAGHLDSCPTDQQAEVLIPDAVPHRAIIGVVVKDRAQAQNETARLRIAKAKRQSFKFVIAPTLFDKRELDKCITAGTLPAEIIWKPGTR